MDENMKDRRVMIAFLRLSAFGFLLGYMYLIFATVRFSSAVWIGLPVLWFTPGHYSWLIFPILFNVAVWRPRCYTYLFLKGILRIEKYRLGIIFSLNVLIAIAGGIILDEVTVAVKLSGGALLYVFIVQGVIKHEDIRSYFGWIDEKEDLGYSHKKYVYIFAIYLGVFAIGLGERGIAYSHYEDLVEQTQRSIYTLDDLSKVDIDTDKEMYLGTFSSGSFKGDVGIYSLKTGEEIKKLGIKEAWQSCFIPNSQDILVRKLDASGNGKSWHYEIVDMSTAREKMRMVQTLHGEGFFSYKLLFSSDGRYFATVGRGMSIWDCRDGKEITYLDSESYTETLAWTGDRTFLMVELLKREKDNDLDSSLRTVMQYRIVDNHETVRVEKKKITESLRQKVDNLRTKQRNATLEKGGEENTVLMMVSGELKSDYLSGRTYLEIWDTEKEELLFSLMLNERITAAQIHPDKKHLVVFEGNLNDNMIITYWDIKSQEKVKTHIIAKLERWLPDTENPSLGKTIVFAEQGKKFIQLENKLYIVTLEE